MLMSFVVTIAAAAVPPQGADRSAPVVITPDNLELNGAGRFRFEPDQTAFREKVPDDGFVDRVWFDPSGRAVACDVVRTTSPEAARLGCVQLLRGARFERVAGYDMPFRRGFVDVRFSQGGKRQRTPDTPVVALPTPAYADVAITYPAAPVPDTALLGPGDGQFMADVRPDDYPPAAMRAGLSARSTVLLGVEGDGTVKSCRPVGSVARGAALLDNRTCVVMLRSARFAFANGAPRGADPYYYRMSMVWKLP